MVEDDGIVFPVLKDLLRLHRIVALRNDDWFHDEIGYRLVFPKRPTSKLQPIVNVSWSGLELVQNTGAQRELLIVSRFLEAIDKIYKKF